MIKYIFKAIPIILLKMIHLSLRARLGKTSCLYRQRSTRNFTSPPFPGPPGFKVSDEVRDAVANHRPIVAMESAIYTHGFPYPENLVLAQDLEQILRNEGVVPATIGVLDGVARVGMKPYEIDALATSAGKPDTMKVSRRDLPYILGMVCWYRFKSNHFSLPCRESLVAK